MATDAQSLMTQASCYSCFGNSMYFLTLMRLALWRQYLLQLNPGATVDPQGLLDLAKCYECFGSNKYALQLMRIAMLAQMASGMSPVNPIASDWAQRVVANGGTRPSTQTILALSNFLNSIESLQSRIWHFNPIVPDSLIAMRTPLINTFGSGLWARNVVGTGFAETLDATGWQGSSDGTNGIVYDTGVNPSLIPSFGNTNGGLDVYLVSGISSQGLAGCLTAGATRGYYLTLQNVSSITQMFGLGSLITTPAPASLSGFYSSSRTSNTSLNLYFASSGSPWASIGSSAVAATQPPPNLTAAFGGINALGTYVPAKQKISCYIVRDGLNSADGQTLFNAVQSLRVALGGGFA